MKHLAAAAIAASLLCAAPFARAVTIDFGNTPNTFPLTTYTEDNFQFTVLSGNQWAIANFVGNPPSALVAGFSGPIGTGDTISVMQLGGGLFTFASLDFASIADGSQTDGVSLIGFVNGVQTQIYSNLNTSNDSFQTLNPLFLAPIDELRIVGASQAQASLILDNFVFNAVGAAVPEAGSSALLFGVALVGLFLFRRRFA